MEQLLSLLASLQSLTITVCMCRTGQVGHLGGDKVVLRLITVLPPLGKIFGALPRLWLAGVLAVAGQIAGFQGIIICLVVLKAID